MWEKKNSVRMACALLVTLLIVFAPSSHAVYNLTLGPADTVNDTATKQTSQFADDGQGGCSLGSSVTSCVNITSSEVQLGQSPDPANPACLEQDLFKSHFHYNTTRLPLSSVILGINWTFNVVTASAEVGANYRITQLGRQISALTCSGLHTGSTIQFNVTTTPSIASTGNKSILFNPTAIATMTANKTTNFFAFSMVYYANPQSMASIGTKEGSNPAWLSVNYTMKPNTTAVSPASGNTTLGTTQYFNCTAQDDDGLTNVSLYGNWSGSWALNQTNSTPRNASDHIFTVNGLNPGAYSWGCRSWDNWGADNSSANLSFTMNSSCGNLTGNYTLNNDVYANDTCFTLGANNVTLDCNGFSIIGNKTGMAINATNYQNFTVQNCTISNFSTVLYAHQTHNITLANSTFSINYSDNNDHDLFVWASSNNIQFLNNRVLANDTPTTTPIVSLFKLNGTSVKTYFYNNSINFTGYGDQVFTAYGLFTSIGNSGVNFSFNNISMNAPGASLTAIYTSGSGMNLTGNRIEAYAPPSSTQGSNTGVIVFYSNATIVSNSISALWGDTPTALFLGATGVNNTLISNSFTCFGGASSSDAISISGSRNSSLMNSTVNASGFGMMLTGAYNLFMANTTFLYSTGANLRLTSNSGNITLLNSSYSMATPITFSVGKNNYTAQWYVRANISYANGNPISSASVNITNATGGTPLHQLSTGTDGLTPFAIVTSFSGNATVNTSYFPFTINATFPGYAANTTSANITNYTPSTYLLLLNNGNNAPNVSLNTPANNNITKNRAVNFSFIPDDDLAGYLNCSLYTNESTPWANTQNNQSAIVNGSINWINYTFSADGAYKWNVYCSDNGTTPLTNFSIANRTVFVDATYPTSLFYNASSTHTGNRSQNYYFVNLSFTEANLNNCILEINGATNVTMTAVAAGSFCYINRTSQSEGTYSYKVYVNDTAGNLNISATQAVTLDTTPPTNLAFDPTTTAAQNVSQNFYFVKLSFTEVNPANCTLEVNGVTNLSMTVDTISKFCSLNRTSQSDGTYTYKIYVNDTAGNLNTSSSRKVTLDTTFPTSLSYNSSNMVTGNKSQNFFYVNLTFTESNPANCTLEVNGTSNFSMTVNTLGQFCTLNRTNQADGTFTYKVYLNDTAGNLNTSTAQSITLDTTYPQVGWSAPTPTNGTTWPNATVIFNISIVESNLNATRLDVNGTNYSLDCNSGSCSQSLTLTNGTYWYYTIANDSAGNANSTPSRMLIVADTTPAGTTSTPPSGGGIGSSSTPPQIIASASWNGNELTCEFRVVPGTYSILRVETGYTSPGKPQTTVVPEQTGTSTYRFKTAASNVGTWKCRGVVYDISGRTGYGESSLQIGSPQGTPSPSPSVAPTPKPTSTPVPTLRPTPTPAPSPQENLISQVYQSISTAQALLLQTRASGIDTQNAENKLITARALASKEEYLKALALVREAELDLSNKIAQMKNDGKQQPYAAGNPLQSWILAAGVGLTVLAAAWWAFLRKPAQSPSDRRKK